MHCLSPHLISVINEENLDKEWAELIFNALKMGISIEEIRAFLGGAAK